MTTARVIEIDPNKQYQLAGDISGSMTEVDPKCNNDNRYNYMLEKFKSFIKEAESFDPDGPTVLLFGESVQVFKNTNLEAVSSKLTSPIFEGFTNTHLVIRQAYDLHKAEKGELAKAGKVHPGTVVFVFTDGAPTNRKALEEEIVTISNSIDRDDEFSIGFLTVGTISADLDAYLTHLDDELKGKAKYDIVDVKKLEDIIFLKAVEGAMND